MITTYTYDRANRLKQKNAGGTITTYTLDAAGNRTSETTGSESVTYQWDAAGRMVAAEVASGTVTFIYNTDGQRTVKQATDGSATGFLYDYKRLLHETDEVGGDITKSYAVGTSEEYGDLIGEDGEMIHQYDAQANTNALLDNTGMVAAQYKYTAFGQVAAVSVEGGTWTSFDTWASLTANEWGSLSVDAWAELPVELTSNMLAGGRKQYYLDPETELYLLGMGTTGRYYDPAVGKFISEDPIRHKAGDPNLLRYVKNNPVNHLDPSGHDDDSDEARKKAEEAARRQREDNQAKQQQHQQNNVPGEKEEEKKDKEQNNLSAEGTTSSANGPSSSAGTSDNAQKDTEPGAPAQNPAKNNTPDKKDQDSKTPSNSTGSNASPPNNNLMTKVPSETEQKTTGTVVDVQQIMRENGTTTTITVVYPGGSERTIPWSDATPTRGDTVDVPDMPKELPAPSAPDLLPPKNDVPTIEPEHDKKNRTPNQPTQPPSGPLPSHPTNNGATAKTRDNKEGNTPSSAPQPPSAPPPTSPKNKPSGNDGRQTNSPVPPPLPPQPSSPHSVNNAAPNPSTASTEGDAKPDLSFSTEMWNKEEIGRLQSRQIELSRAINDDPAGAKFQREGYKGGSYKDVCDEDTWDKAWDLTVGSTADEHAELNAMRQLLMERITSGGSRPAPLPENLRTKFSEFVNNKQQIADLKGGRGEWGELRKPGTVENWIPGWNGVMNAGYNLQHGNTKTGIFNAATAITDMTGLPIGKVVGPGFRFAKGLFSKGGEELAEKGVEALAKKGSGLIVESGKDVLKTTVKEGEELGVRGADEAAELKPYEGPGGGHHVPAKSAMEGATGVDPQTGLPTTYNPKTALAIPNTEMAKLGIKHIELVTPAQRALYTAFTKTGAPLTWDAVESIETQALIRGGALPGVARATVQQAIQPLKAAGMTPTRIPWN